MKILRSFNLSNEIIITWKFVRFYEKVSNEPEKGLESNNSKEVMIGNKISQEKKWRKSKANVKAK